MERPAWSESLLKLPAQMANAARAARLLKRERIELVHCNSAAGVEAAFAAKVLSLPVVVHCRELFRNNPYGFSAGGRAACRLVDRLSDKIVCVSKAVREQFAEVGVKSSKLVVVYDSFDGPWGGPSSDGPEVGERPGESVVGCVGGIHPRKGHETLLRAFALVLRDFPRARLVIVGGGKDDYVGALRVLAEKLGIAETTEFVGQAKEPGEYYKRFAVFALPSLAEAFGLVYGEAALCGVPAIGASDGGAGEIIEDGRTGFLVPPGDCEALAARIAELLRDPGLARRMGERARARVKRVFGKDALVESVVRVYDELLAGGGTQRWAVNRPRITGKG